MTSKPLEQADISGFDFVKEMLHGDPTYGINFDRIQWDSKLEQYVIIELLLCEEKQSVTPYTSHPNRYFHKNSRKFLSLWEISKQLKSKLYLVNYSKKGTKHENEILFMIVNNVDKKDNKNPVKTTDKKMTRETFSKHFRNLNLRGKKDL